MASEMLQMCAVALLLRTICSLREDREFRARNTVLRTRRHGSGWRTSLRHCVELFVDCEGLSVPIKNVAQGVIFKMLCQAKRGQNHGI